MLSSIKIIIKKAVIKLTAIFSNTKLGKIINEQIIVDVMSQEKKAIHNGYEMSFCVPNQLNHFRIDTFSEKEPETLEWIDTFPNNSILWDVGANIGLYSIYAAASKNCNVVAFEPSVFNLELLARNISLNNLQDKITIFPLALSNKLNANRMRLTTVEWGGALSSFGEKIGWDGKQINDIFSYSVNCSISFSLKGESSERIIPTFSFFEISEISLPLASNILMSIFSFFQELIVSEISPPEWNIP